MDNQNIGQTEQPNPDQSIDKQPDVMIEPANQSAVPQQPESDNSDEIIIYDSGYLQNLFQKSFGAKQVTLSLYKSHLKIEDSNSGELLEDVPINQIKVKSRYFSSRILYTLYGMIMPTTLRLKTNEKRYIISWVNRDKEAFAIGGAASSEVSSQQNYTRNMKWIKALRDLGAN